MITVQVTEPWQDTLNANAEVASGELVSDATAKLICSWYASVPVMTAFAHGEAVTGISLRYAVGTARRDYLTMPDYWGAGDVANLDAVLAWIADKLLTLRV